MTKRKPASKGTAICGQCYELISLEWFALHKPTGKVVHDCGRILYEEKEKKG